MASKIVSQGINNVDAKISTGLREREMQRKSVSAVMLTLLLMGMLTLTLSIQTVSSVNPVSVEVPGTAGLLPPPDSWVPSGVLLSAGVTVSITATGSVSWDGGDYWAGPDGASWWPLPNPLLPGAPVAALIGKVGSGPIFLVGSGPTVATGDGELIFAVNDEQGAHYNNVGSFLVAVTTPDDFSVVSVEPIQVVEDPLIFPEFGPYPTLVSGKPTVLNVTINSWFAYSQMTSINITYPNGIIAEFPVRINSGMHSYYFPNRINWPYSFIPKLKEGFFQTVKVGINSLKNPQELTYSNNQNSSTFIVADTNGFPNGIFFAPLDVVLSPKELSTMADNSMSFLLATYPINKSQAKYDTLRGIPVSTSIRQGVPRPDSALIALNVLATLTNRDRYIGVVDDNWFNLWDSWPHWGKKGYAFMNGLKKAAIVTYGYYTVTAHEVGHTLGLDDEKVDREATGYWVEGDEVMKSFGNSIRVLCFMGSVAPTKWPYDSNVGMRAWIEKQDYEFLFSKMLRKGNDPELLLVNGIIFRNGTTLLEEFYRLLGGVPDYIQDSTGNFSVRLLDRDELLLSQVSFNLTFMGNEDLRPFSFTIPSVQNASKISISYDGSEVATRTISVNSPSVHILSPNGGEVFNEGENVTISWQADDADGDSLAYTVLYSENNGSSWQPITTGLSNTSLNWTIPITLSTDKYIIKIIATDGVNTGEDVSDATFTILRHDISTTEVHPPKSAVGAGFSMPLNIAITNEGNYTETFNITAYANSTSIASQIVTISSGNSIIASFVWNTSGFVKDSYTISAYARPVPGEIDTLDNTYTYGTVIVALPCDVANRTSPDIGIPDGRVNYVDLFWFLKAYGKRLGDPGWNPNVDVAGGTTWSPAAPDDIVNYKDIFWLLKYYGQSDP